MTTAMAAYLILLGVVIGYFIGRGFRRAEQRLEASAVSCAMPDPRGDG